MPTGIVELIGRQVTEDEIQEMALKCSENDARTIGGFKVLNRQDMINIYRMANK